jgi:hypothetical protein
LVEGEAGCRRKKIHKNLAKNAKKPREWHESCIYTRVETVLAALNQIPKRREVRMKRFVLFVLVAGLVLAVSGAWAITLQPNVNTWQSWTTGVLDEDGTPYWDGNSSDYNPYPANIGYWLTKTGAWAPGGPAPAAEKAKSPGVAYDYLGNSDGTAITNVYFTATAPALAAIQIEVAGLKNLNYFGIYKQGTLPTNLNDLLQPGGGPGDTWKRLFTGSDSPSSLAVTFVAPWSDFGFYLATETSVGSGVVAHAFFSESGLNSGADQNKQHFAFFRAKGGAYPAYYIGVEDKPGLGDKDYQDFVVYIKAIPDAPTLMLFLSGVPALVLLRRKRA